MEEEDGKDDDVDVDDDDNDEEEVIGKMSISSIVAGRVEVGSEERRKVNVVLRARDDGACGWLGLWQDVG